MIIGANHGAASATTHSQSVCVSGLQAVTGQTFTGGAITIRVFEDTVSSQFVVTSPGQTYTGGAMTARTFGS